MATLQDLLREIHRRSVWQVLGVYLAGSWLVIQVVETLTESAGLPDWVPPGAIVLLLIGLPVVLATAVVQRGIGGGGRAEPGQSSGSETPGDPSGALNLAAGTGSLDRPSTRPPAAHRVLTWRNAILGGVLAFVLLGLAAGGYWLMWASGIGPVGSLVAQGVLDERDPVILSDFQNLTQDASLGEVVTEALRVDLDRSGVLSPISPAAVRQVLQRMNRADADALTPDLALEAAQREGIKAVIEGEIGSAGSGYVLTSRVVGANGDVLASFRVTARDGSGVIDAIDELSKDMRERSGESLRAINRGEPLSAVTTGSLEALRRYSQAMNRTMTGERSAAVRLLEEAIEHDPDFAMAYRKLGVELGNLGMDAGRQLDAVRRAYELRGRLTHRERDHAEASYFAIVAPDLARAAEAYERVLAAYPDDGTALNNLALIYTQVGRHDDAVALMQRAVSGPGATPAAHTNLLEGYWRLRRDEEARALLDLIEQRYAGTNVAAQAVGELALSQRRWEDAHELSRERLRNAGSEPGLRLEALADLVAADAARGKLAEAREHSAEALWIALEEDQESWVWLAAAQRAWYELWVARDRATARSTIERVLEAHAYEGGYVDAWDLFNLLSMLALAGDVDRSASLAALATDTEERDRFWDDAYLYYQFSEALARNESEAALTLVDRARDQSHCDDTQRCWLSFEAGLALEAAGRTEDAIASYEEHLGGTALTEAPWDGVNTAASLEQLCHLSAEAGDQARVQEHCNALVELWQDADPELQPRIRAARERLARALAPGVGP